jgi:anti-anti-sigma factor
MSLAITVNGSHVGLSGAVDLETSPSLRAELLEIISVARPGDVLRLNLGDVSLLDSSGLSVLLGVHQLAALPRHVERTLSITGLDEVLHIAG